MADWDRDRYERYGGRDRADRYGRDDYAGRWGSGDYRVNDDRDRAYDRHDYGRDFTSGYGGGYGTTGADYERTSGASGNYFGGGGYGSMRDYDTYRDAGAGAGRQSFRGRGPKNFQRSDERLRELISERLEEHDDIDASDIELTVSNGEVTLNGTVDSRRTKRLAEDLAATTYGIRDVHNNLRVDQGFFDRLKDTMRDTVRGREG